MKKTMTPAAIMKRIKILETQKDLIIRGEKQNSTYIDVGNAQVAFIPSYDFDEVRESVRKIDSEIFELRYALNQSNANNSISYDLMTPGEALVQLGQMSEELKIVQELARRETVENDPFFSMKNNGAIVYRVANYDVQHVREYRDALQEKISELQMSLDEYNLTAQIEVET